MIFIIQVTVFIFEDISVLFHSIPFVHKMHCIDLATSLAPSIIQLVQGLQNYKHTKQHQAQFSSQPYKFGTKCNEKDKINDVPIHKTVRKINIRDPSNQDSKKTYEYRLLTQKIGSQLTVVVLSDLCHINFFAFSFQGLVEYLIRCFYMYQTNYNYY